MGCIYRIVCHVNGRSYVGQTAFSHPFVRFREHQREAQNGEIGTMYEDMRMLGIHEFECICLRVAPNDQLNDLECYYAEQYNAYEWLGGYNSGECGTHTKVSKDVSDERRLWMKRTAIRRQFFKNH